MNNKHGCCVDKACTPKTCMHLPDELHCGDCVHARRCTTLFGHTLDSNSCDWFPRRFRLRGFPLQSRGCEGTP